MGNCCSGNANEGEVNIVKGPSTKQMQEVIFDDREVLGLRGTEKMKILIRI